MTYTETGAIGKPGSNAEFIVPDRIDIAPRYDRWGIERCKMANKEEHKKKDMFSVNSGNLYRSKNEKYALCQPDYRPEVLFFEDGEFVFKKEKFADPMGVPSEGGGGFNADITNDGTVAYGNYPPGEGYPEADERLLNIWDRQGNEIFSTSLQTTFSQLTFSPDGDFLTLMATEVLTSADSYKSSEYDHSVYILDVQDGQILGRYMDKIPGIEPKTRRNQDHYRKYPQISAIEFVENSPDPLIALFESSIDATKFLPTSNVVGNTVEVTDGSFKAEKGEKGEIVWAGETRNRERNRQLDLDQGEVSVILESVPDLSEALTFTEDEIRILDNDQDSKSSLAPTGYIPKTLSEQNLPEEVTLIDIEGNIVNYGRPQMDNHPDAYVLTDEAKERFDLN